MGIIYLGALLLPQDSYMITALRPDGELASPAFPIPCMKTPAIPTQFKGVISFAGEAIWDCAWYGFMSRHFTDGQNAPGRIIEWHHELDYPTQVVALATEDPRYDALLITCPTPSCFYFVHWDKQRQKLDLTRRFGCLPDIYSLGLSEDGYITAGTARTQLWWRWEDGPDSPCRKADIHIAVTPPYFRNESCLAVGAQYELSGKNPLTLAIFRRTPGDRNEASRVVWQIPIRKPVGQSVRETPGSDNGVLFLTDADQKQIWAIDLWLPQLRPNADTWRTLTIEGAALTAPTDIVALTDGRLLLADAGRILMLEPRGEGYTLSWEFSQWGERPDQQFGKRLRIAADGTRMLVSDTERHRIVYLDWQQREVIAQFGETDKAGDDLSHVNQPTLLSLRGSRAVVADSGNQRILKLVME